MLIAFKTEIKPTSEQGSKIRKTIGTCRFIYNFYLGKNKEYYDETKGFLTANDFSKWLNNEFLPNNSEYSWIKDVSTKATKQAMVNCEKAFKKFFFNSAGYPKFKKKNDQDVKAYFPKNNKTDWIVERHRIKIPTLGFVRVKEFGYIPVGGKVKSGTVSMKADRYYVSVLVELADKPIPKATGYGKGVDVGVKELAVVSDGAIHKNINKTAKVRKLEKKLKREQRRLSRKYEFKKKNKKGGATYKNISKQVLQLQKLHQRLSNIRTHYTNKVVSMMVKTKPQFITIEDLNIRGMMKNKHLARSISQQKLHEFKTILARKCHLNGVELRMVDRFYPSSKLCSSCGKKHPNLKLKDRVYKCECGANIDRDLNAAINLKNATKYAII